MKGLFLFHVCTMALQGDLTENKIITQSLMNFEFTGLINFYVITPWLKYFYNNLFHI